MLFTSSTLMKHCDSKNNVYNDATSIMLLATLKVQCEIDQITYDSSD